MRKTVIEQSLLRTLLTISFVLFVMPWKCISQQIQSDIAKRTYLYAVKKDSLWLDKYETENTHMSRPCVIFAFGGGFRAGVRDDKGYMDYFNFLAEQGIVVISIDYRRGLKSVKPKRPADVLKPMENAIMMAVEDMYDATNYVIGHAVEWKVNPEQIVISGSSAGAITALQAEYERVNNNLPAIKHLPEDFRYAGVIAFAGAIFQKTEDLVWQKKPAPILLFHGDADASVPYDHLRVATVGLYGSDYLAKKLHEMQSPYCIYRFPGAGHEISSSPMHRNLPEIGNFIREMVVAKSTLMIDVRCEVIGKIKKEQPKGLEDFIRSNFR